MALLRMNDGETLRKFCLRTGINYDRIWHIIEETGYSPEDAVEEFRRRKLKPKHLYFIGKIPLTYVCKELGVLLSSVINRTSRTGETEAEALIMILIDKKHKG